MVKLSRTIARLSFRHGDKRGKALSKNINNWRRLEEAADGIISAYQGAIEVHQASIDAETIWKCLLNYSGKLAAYIGELVDVPKKDFEKFRQSEKFHHIVSLNVIMAAMTANLIRSSGQSNGEAKLDVFLSHAGEQKAKTVEPLHDALTGFRCFFDQESLNVGDFISSEIKEALLECNVGMVLVSRDFVQKRWPLLELFVLSSRATIQIEEGFKLFVATLEDGNVCSDGWENWFDCVHKLPLPLPSDGMPTALKLTGDGGPDDIRMLSKALTTVIHDCRKSRTELSLKNSVCVEEAVSFKKQPSSYAGIPQIKQIFGREETLQKLETRHSSMVALVGPAGMGKSQCAIEAAWRFLQGHSEDRVVFWLRSEQEAGLKESYLGALRRLGINLNKSTGLLDLANLLWQQLGQSKYEWLLVFDNVPESIKASNGEILEGPRAFQPWFFRTPLSGWARGRILFTTRSDLYRGKTVLGHITPIDLAKLDADDAILMFHSEDMRDFQWSEDAARILMTEHLDGLPLAIEIASSQIAHQRITVLDYVQNLNLAQVKDKVGAVLRSALGNARESGLGYLLDIVAFINPDQIQVELLKKDVDDQESINRLCDLNILRQIDPDTYSIHRLHQGAARVARTPTAAIGAVTTITESFNQHRPANWKLCLKMLPHIESIIRNCGDQGKESVADLCFHGGRVSYHAAGDLRAAKLLFQASLSMYHETFGGNATSVAIAEVLSFIGRVCCRLADYEGALEKYEEVQQMNLKMYGKNAKNLSSALNLDAIGTVRTRSGDCEGALDKYEEALAMHYELIESEERKINIARTLHHMGNAYSRMKKYELALKKYEEALAINYVVFGKDAKNQQIASSLSQIGKVLFSLGDNAGARKLYEESLSMKSLIFGENAQNDYIAGTTARLGNVYSRCGDFEGARKKYEEALVMHRFSYGHDSSHINILDDLKLLVDVCEKLGDKEAVMMHQAELDKSGEIEQ